MNDIINLDNNYYLKLLNNNTSLPTDVMDIKNLNLINIVRGKKLLLKIDFCNFDYPQYKKILKKLLFIKKLLFSKIQIGKPENSQILLGYIINYNKTNKQHSDFILGINSVLFNSKYERYNYIYDTVCNYLDSCFYGKNLCDFHNNKCGEKRNASSLTGCCHHFKIKALGPFSKLVLCEYLKDDYSCKAKCISCKLFTCDYLEKKGIKFRIKDILLLNAFFNPIQKYFIKYMVFTPKEKIIKRLMFLSL